MSFLRRMLKIEDKQYKAEATAVSEEIYAAQMEKQENTRLIELRAQQQSLNIRSSERVLNTWQGASAILRDHGR